MPLFISYPPRSIVAPMMLAKELAAAAWNDRINPLLAALGLEYDQGLPLDTLDGNIECKDALFEDWPPFDVVIGNPPYQSKNKMKQEFGGAYVERIRHAFPEVPGKADFCVYWFRKAHQLIRTFHRF
jgi:type II restriction/modification system DNA methylase subunit YeeA